MDTRTGLKPPRPGETTSPFWLRLSDGKVRGLVTVALVLAALLLLLAFDASGTFLYQQNEFVTCALLLVGFVGASWGGNRLGRLTEERSRGRMKSQTNEVQTAIFALLGLLLAFTFSMAISRYEARRQAVVEEANAIRSVYLQSHLLPSARQSATVILLRQYVDLRLESAQPYWYTNTTLKAKTSKLQKQLWAQAVAAGQEDPSSNIRAQFVVSMNELITAQNRRDAARLFFLPGSAIYLLVAVSILGVGILGYRVGLANGRSVFVTLLLVPLITVLLLVIIDLDRPYQGLVTISQQPMVELRQSMQYGAP